MMDAIKPAQLLGKDSAKLSCMANIFYLYFLFCMYSILVFCNTCTSWRYWIYGNFLTYYSLLLLRALLLSFPRNILNITILPLLGRYPFIYLRSSLHPEACGIYKDTRNLIMRLCDVLRTSTTVLNRNKIIRTNTSLILLYAQVVMWHVQQQS